MQTSRSMIVSSALAAAGIAALLNGASLKAAVTAAVRNIYLNGTDISSARSQELKNVDLVINEKGDIFIVAPHYQVNEEDSYIPLSKFAQGTSAPKHQPMKKMETEPNKPMEPTPVAPPTADMPLTKANPDGSIPKAGTPMNGNAPAEALPAGGTGMPPANDAPAAEPVKMVPPAP